VATGSNFILSVTLIYGEDTSSGMRPLLVSETAEFL
jgi:hypothetical protein